jgi:hypothetical protein
MLRTACVVGGGPLFAEGLRARASALLALPVLAEPRTNGFCAWSARSRREPASPLSQRPCAGYQLEVRVSDGSVRGRVGQQRGFRLVSGECDAFVEEAGSEWVMPVTAERKVAAGEKVSANMAALLDRDANLRWLRARRVPAHIVERSIEAGANVEVIGCARSVETEASLAEAVAEAEMLAATGTDGAAFAVATPPRADRPSLRLASAEPLVLHVVADGSVSPMRFAPSRWRVAGALAGPILSLAGLLYLAHAAEATLAGRF